MKITARFAPGWPCSASPAPQPSRLASLAPGKDEHPIIRDQVAVENAIALLLSTGRNNAISREVTPEDDVASAALRQEHGALAAYIVDPIGEACADAAALLLEHLKRIVPDSELSAAAARIDALAGKASRYGRLVVVRH